MNLQFFTNPEALKVGNIVAGPSSLVAMRLFGKIGMPLYKVVAIVNWRFLWLKKHYAKLRRISDGEVYKINLDPPAFDWTARSAPIDVRENWAQLVF